MNDLRSTAEEILASAQGFIVSGGYNAFSYADIAGVVGIRKASIHHHFPTKLDLVRTLVAQYREAAASGLTELEAMTPEPLALLQAYADIWARCIEDASLPFCVCALLAAELPVLPAPVADEVRAHFRFLSGWLAAIMARGAQDGSLRLDGTPAVEAEMFMATVHGAMLSARASGTPLVFEAVMAPTLRRLAATGS